jgi:hypothetical protein
MQLNIEAELPGALGQQSVVSNDDDWKFVVRQLQAKIRANAGRFAGSNGEGPQLHFVPLRYSTVARSRN